MIQMNSVETAKYDSHLIMLLSVVLSSKLIFLMFFSAFIVIVYLLLRTTCPPHSPLTQLNNIKDYVPLLFLLLTWFLPHFATFASSIRHITLLFSQVYIF